jgi:hypothetical protein
VTVRVLRPPGGGAAAGAVRGRPATGLGHYLRDVVYGASDGVVTTLAVVAGAIGAAFEPKVAIVLGLANLAADGLSMGASNYLGLKSELEQNGVPLAAEMPWRHGLATFAAFVAAGAVPLLAFVRAMPGGRSLAKAAGCARETTVGDERHPVAHALAVERCRGGKHLAHAGAAFRALVADDQHLALLVALGAHRGEGILLAIEAAGGPAELEPFHAGNLDDGAVGRE